METALDQTAKKTIVRSRSPLLIWIPLWPRTHEFGILSNRNRVSERTGFYMQEARMWKSYFLSFSWFTLALNIMKRTGTVRPPRRSFKTTL